MKLEIPMELLAVDAFRALPPSRKLALMLFLERWETQYPPGAKATGFIGFSPLKTRRWGVPEGTHKRAVRDLVRAGFLLRSPRGPGRAMRVRPGRVLAPLLRRHAAQGGVADPAVSP